MRPYQQLLALWAALIPCYSHAKTCLMLYQVADNNLEFYLRQDYEELANSAIVRSPDLRTWIYYDAFNQGGMYIPHTLDATGTAISSTFHGSRYVTYDQEMGMMRVDVQMDSEQNSDRQTTVQHFLEHAMRDCLANGYDQLMAVFASHGGGFAGYGGDENVRRHLSGLRGSADREGDHRHLLQSNQGLATAIRAALDNTEGASERLDVIGFDACLMSAVGAADDYHPVAEYLLASEAVEPGHGWSYIHLLNASTPLDLAHDIVHNFIIQKQGRARHQAPKTLAIVNTDKFVTFIDYFDLFTQKMMVQLEAGDVSLHAFVSRARASSVAFEGIADIVGTSNPSALDIGSFLENLDELCNPGGEMGGLLLATREAYREMFVTVGVGPGTAPATGMHITWPHQGEYQSNTALWNQILFTNGNYVTTITPNFQAFIRWFLTSAAPIATTTEGGEAASITVCGLGAEPDPGTPVEEGALILTDSGEEDPTTGMFNVQVEIAPQVSQMVVEYGLDLSTPLKPVLVDKGYTPRDDEYLYLLGGDVTGSYAGSKFEASWDKNFYFLNITTGTTAAYRSGLFNISSSSGNNDNNTGTTPLEDQAQYITERGFEALYVFDEGDGSKKIPAMYFPEEKRFELSRMQFLDYLFFDFEYWVEQGARYSFLKFSVNETVGRINDNLALYISDMNNGFSEQPREAGGLILPLISIDAYIQGRKLNMLPGGFNQTVIEWKSNLNYNILTTSAEQIFNVIPTADAVMVNCYAHNLGDPESLPEAKYYDVIRKDRQGNLEVGSVEGGDHVENPVLNEMIPSGEDASGFDAQVLHTNSASGAPNHFRIGTSIVLSFLGWLSLA